MNKELIEKVDDWLTDYGRDCFSGIEDYYQKDTKKAQEIISLCQQDFKELKSEAEFNIGKWLSAALDDENVCAEMKADIVKWFTFIEGEK